MGILGLQNLISSYSTPQRLSLVQQIQQVSSYTTEDRLDSPNFMQISSDAVQLQMGYSGSGASEAETKAGS